MSKVILQHKLNQKASNSDIFAKRNARLLSIINKCHKISLWHKIKEKLLRKSCSICKELEGLK